MEELLEKKETKNDKFIRLAELRINAILEQFRKLGNLSNRRNYEYSEEDIKKMFFEINKALRRTRDLFGEEKGQKKSFKFKE